MTPDSKKIMNGKNEKIFNTENMLPISEIRWNTIILKDSWLRAIIKVSWLNLDLKNYEEQQIVIEQYKKFLNWLSFPIQILARSTYLDLTEYLTYMRQNVDNLDNDVLKEQWNKYLWFLDEINSRQWLIYTKEFYIIVPYYAGDVDNPNVRKPWWQQFLNALNSVEIPEKIAQRYRGFIKNRKFLDTRVALITEWLRWFWVFSERLELHDIVSLLFKVNNPNSHKSQAEVA